MSRRSDDTSEERAGRIQAAITAEANADAVAVVRDVRIDQILVLDELKKLVADKMREAVRDRHKARITSVAKSVKFEGDIADGRVTMSEGFEIDAEKFYNLIKKEEITKAEFLAAITVNSSEAAKLLSQKTLDKISAPKIPTFMIVITRKKTVPLVLASIVAAVPAAVTAIREQLAELAREVAGGQ